MSGMEPWLPEIPRTGTVRRSLFQRFVVLPRRLGGVPVVGQGRAEAAVGGDGRGVLVDLGVVEGVGGEGLGLQEPADVLPFAAGEQCLGQVGHEVEGEVPGLPRPLRVGRDRSRGG